MSAGVLNHDPVSTPAAVLSVLVHVALFAFLFFGIRWQSKLPDAVVVELWDRPPALEQPLAAETPKPEPKAEPKPEPKVEPKVEPTPKPEPKVEVKVEVKPVKPDIAVEKERKPPPKKKEPPPKKKEPPRKLEPVLRKFDRAAELQRQASREVEQVSRASKPFQPLPAGPIVDASYANKIKTKIRSNVVLPAGLTGNPEAIFEVVQLPSGDVISARLRQSSGNRAYDDAVERAILKSSPLPRPDRPDQFARELQLKFRPVE
jgi:colicin import membrane protein